MHDYTVKFSPGRQSDAVAEGNEQQLRRSMFVTADAAGDDERVSAAWLLAADYERPRRCRQLLQLHPAPCVAASSKEMEVLLSVS